MRNARQRNLPIQFSKFCGRQGKLNRVHETLAVERVVDSGPSLNS